MFKIKIALSKIKGIFDDPKDKKEKDDVTTGILVVNEFIDAYKGILTGLQKTLTESEETIRKIVVDNKESVNNIKNAISVLDTEVIKVVKNSPEDIEAISERLDTNTFKPIEKLEMLTNLLKNAIFTPEKATEKEEENSEELRVTEETIEKLKKHAESLRNK